MMFDVFDVFDDDVLNVFDVDGIVCVVVNKCVCVDVGCARVEMNENVVLLVDVCVMFKVWFGFDVFCFG